MPWWRAGTVSERPALSSPAGSPQRREPALERREMLAGVLGEEDSSSTLLDPIPEDETESDALDEAATQEALTGRAGLSCDEQGRIKVRVVKACRNPRLADCLVLEGEQEGKRILVDVRRSALFIPGMVFEAVRPRGDSRFSWHYTGALPRFRGRWRNGQV